MTSDTPIEKIFTSNFAIKVVYPIALIIFLGLIIYSNTFSSTFHFDDGSIIFKDVYSVQDLPNLLSKFSLSQTRYFGFLTFALNFKLHETSTFGYRLVNITIHIINSVLTWQLLSTLLRTPVIQKSFLKKHRHSIGLLAGLIFLAHPIQTQAITYIVQRFASMATMFYLAALLFFLKARLRLLQTSLKDFRKMLPIALFTSLSIAAAILGIYTKEIVITLPIMAFFTEIYFFTSQNLKKKLAIFSTIASSLVVGSFLLAQTINFAFIFSSKQTPMKETVSIVTYLLTQFRVITKYIQLLFFPISQNVDYYFPISKSIFEPATFASFIVLTIVFISAIYLFKRHRLLSFSIIWFYLSLSVESSIIPIEDVIFEHRLYLPMFGFATFVSTIIFYLFHKKNANELKATIIVLLLTLSFLTYQRNNVWKNEFTLWHDTVSKSPLKARPHVNLGAQYQLRGNLNAAINEYNTVIRIDPDRAAVYNNIGIIFAKQNQPQKAQEQFRKAIEIEPEYQGFHDNLALLIESIQASSSAVPTTP